MDFKIFWWFLNSDIVNTTLIIVCMLYLGRAGVKKSILAVIKQYLSDRKEQDSRKIEHDREERKIKCLEALVDLLNKIISNPNSRDAEEKAVRLERFCKSNTITGLEKKFDVIINSVRDKRNVNTEKLIKVRDDLHHHLLCALGEHS